MVCAMHFPVPAWWIGFGWCRAQGPCPCGVGRLARLLRSVSGGPGPCLQWAPHLEYPEEPLTMRSIMTQYIGPAQKVRTRALTSLRSLQHLWNLVTNPRVVRGRCKSKIRTITLVLEGLYLCWIRRGSFGVTALAWRPMAW